MAKLTGDTITDDQIAELARDARARMEAARAELDAALAAMMSHPLYGQSDRKRHSAARASCAEILNARAKEGR